MNNKSDVLNNITITDRLTNLIEKNKLILNQEFISTGPLSVKVRDIIKDKSGKILFRLESDFGLTDRQLEGIVLRIIRTRKINSVINEEK